MKFLLRNSEKLFYWTGAGLLSIILLLIFMQFTSLDDKLLQDYLGWDENKSAVTREDLSFDDKMEAPGVVLLKDEDDENTVEVEAATRKELEKVVQTFLRQWETFPRDDYRQSLEDLVVSENLTQVAGREDSTESDLVRCQRGCDLRSLFPPQEIPIEVVKLDADSAYLRFSAFVSYKSISARPSEVSGLRPRKYALLLLFDGDRWLVSRAIAR